MFFIQINEFVKLGGDQLIPYYADILGAILPCLSDKEEKIRVVNAALLFITNCDQVLHMYFVYSVNFFLLTMDS